MYKQQTSMAIIAIVAALGLLGVVAVTIVTIPQQQEQKPEDAIAVYRSTLHRDDASIPRTRE
jgi:Flp pilus assembly protein CpaB